MFIKLFKKISYALMLSTAVIATSPLKAMDDRGSNTKSPTRKIDPKSDPNNNNNNVQYKQTKNQDFQEQIDKAKKIEIMKRKIITSKDWVDYTKKVLNLLEENKVLIDRSIVLQKMFSGILEHIIPTGPLAPYKSLFSDIDQFFASKKDDAPFNQAMSLAIKNWIEEAAKNDQEGLTNLWRGLEKCREANFGDPLSKGLEACTFPFYIDQKNSEKDKSFLEIMKHLNLKVISGYGPIKKNTLEMVAKWKNLKRLDLSERYLENLSPLAGSQTIEELDLSFAKVGFHVDLDSLAKMPKLQSLNLFNCQTQFYSTNNLENIAILATSKSLQKITVSKNVDVSSLARRFDFIEKGDYFKVLVRKKP